MLTKVPFLSQLNLASLQFCQTLCSKSLVNTYLCRLLCSDVMTDVLLATRFPPTPLPSEIIEMRENPGFSCVVSQGCFVLFFNSEILLSSSLIWMEKGINTLSNQKVFLTERKILHISDDIQHFQARL